MKNSVSLKVLIIFAHPKRESLNGEILNSFVKGLEETGVDYQIRDLNKEEFNPVYNAEELEKSYEGIVPDYCSKEQEYLLWADIVVWIYPCWNFSMPAILKGYIDKVFLIPNFSFASDEKGVEYLGGLFSSKKGLIIQTLGGSIDKKRKEIGKYPFVQDLTLAMSYAGMKKVQFKQFENIYSFTDKDHPEIKEMLEEVYKFGSSLDELAFNLEAIS